MNSIPGKCDLRRQPNCCGNFIILKHITLGEDSVLELKDIVFGGQKVTDPHRNSFDEQTVPNAKLDDLNPKL